VRTVSFNQLVATDNVEHLGQGIFIPSICTDTRKLLPGQAFLALVGENFDGHDFLEQAVAMGASSLIINNTQKDRLSFLTNEAVDVVLCENTLQTLGNIAKLHREHFATVKVFAITGSCGKTTVKQMLSSILATDGKVLASPNSFNNEIGLPLTLLELDASYKYVVLEMGARATGDVKYLCNIAKPHVSIVTNVAPVHLETMFSLDNIAKIKAEIFTHTIDDGHVIVNVDDQYAPSWFNMLGSQRVTTFAIERLADVTIAFISQNLSSSKIELVTEYGTIDIIIPVPGGHNIMNALGAAAMALAAGLNLEQIKAGLSNLKNVGRRLEYLDGINGSKIIDDSYNANPVSVMAALDILSNYNQHKIFVFSDMLELGSDKEEYHSLIGRQTKKMGIDEFLTVGPLAALAAQEYGPSAKSFSSKNDLIRYLLATLNENSIVLIKGSNGQKLNEIVEKIVLATPAL